MRIRSKWTIGFRIIVFILPKEYSRRSTIYSILNLFFIFHIRGIDTITLENILEIRCSSSINSRSACYISIIFGIIGSIVYIDIFAISFKHCRCNSWATSCFIYCRFTEFIKITLLSCMYSRSHCYSSRTSSRVRWSRF